MVRQIKAAGLLATTGTVKGWMFQKHLAGNGVKTILPDDAVQKSIMAAIYDIKNVRPSRSRSEISADLVAAAESLISQNPEGAQAIIAGCTEIPLTLGQQHLSVPYLDALEILARAAIHHAGLTPVPLIAYR